MMALLILVLLCLAVIYLRDQVYTHKDGKARMRANVVIVLVIVLLWLPVCLGVINLPVCLRG